MNARDVARFLQGIRFRLGHEALLQADLSAHLKAGRFPFKREFVLGPADRVDFLVDGHIAVELKIRCQKRRILRQLERYAAHEVVDSLILVTLTPTGVPPTIAGKPVYVVKLGMSGL